MNNKFVRTTVNVISMLIPLVTFALVIIIVLRSLEYRYEIDKYEEYYFTIDSKESTVVETSYNNEEYTVDKDIKVSEYVSCLNRQFTYDELSDDIKLSIKTLENLYNSSYNYFAFKYVDIYTGFTISYNENQEIFTASTIKAPEAIYLYEMAEEGKVNLDDRITYTQGYYNTGSGILKNTSFNKSYTTRELISYAIIHSDNAAHNMLMDRYGRINMYNFWSEKGTKSIFRTNNNWGVTNANDASIYMLELYRYYNTDTQLSNELMDNFINVIFKPLSGRDGKKNTANKSGWTGSVFHDAAIVFDDNPYVLVVLSNTGGNYSYLFDLTSKLVSNIHRSYWDYKYNECIKIISR